MSLLNAHAAVGRRKLKSASDLRKSKCDQRAKMAARDSFPPCGNRAAGVKMVAARLI
jgi:hypothetical protein